MEFSDRDTLILEFNAGRDKTPVGSGQGGVLTMKNYAKEVADILDETLLINPVLHESPKYGLSLWSPLKPSESGGGTIHAYIWDNREKSFVSVDISTPKSLYQKKVEELIQYTRSFFEVENDLDIVYKTAQNAQTSTWRELAANIIRQRLSLSGNASVRDIDEQLLMNFFPELCEVLEMDKISNPIVVSDGNERKTAWMHWETSGAIIEVDKRRNVAMDIYTCKSFNPQKAEKFTKDFLSLDSIESREF